MRCLFAVLNKSLFYRISKTLSSCCFACIFVILKNGVSKERNALRATLKARYGVQLTCDWKGLACLPFNFPWTQMWRHRPTRGPWWAWRQKISEATNSFQWRDNLNTPATSPRSKRRTGNYSEFPRIPGHHSPLSTSMAWPVLREGIGIAAVLPVFSA